MSQQRYEVELDLTSDNVAVAAILVFRLRARERMNELYAVELEVASPEGVLLPAIDALMGVRLTVSLKRNTLVRYFSGIVIAAEERRGSSAFTSATT